MTPPVRPGPEVRRRKVSDLRRRTEDDPRKRKTYALLCQSLAAARINNVPIFHTADGTIVDGNTRHAALEDLGLDEALCIELPADWSEADVLRFSIATDSVRRALPQEELADKAERFMELTDSTQEAAARELGISPAHLSRALTSVLLPEKHREKAKVLNASKRAIIASEGDAALQDALMAFATTPGADGRLPTRDQITLRRKLLKRGDGPGRKPAGFTIEADGVVATIRIRKVRSTEQLADWFAAQAKRLRENKHIPPTGLRFVFG